MERRCADEEPDTGMCLAMVQSSSCKVRGISLLSREPASDLPGWKFKELDLSTTLVCACWGTWRHPGQIAFITDDRCNLSECQSGARHGRSWSGLSLLPAGQITVERGTYLGRLSINCSRYYLGILPPGLDECRDIDHSKAHARAVASATAPRSETSRWTEEQRGRCDCQCMSNA